MSTAAGSYGIYMLFEKLPPGFPKVLCRVTFPPAVWEAVKFTSQPAYGVLKDSQSSSVGCGVIFSLAFA